MNAHNPKHRNQVRIIGGSCRGRKLIFQSAEGLRPTADSVREKVFNWLGQDLSGQTVLDLFSGSGALGFEAASRHAARTVLCENNRRTADQLARIRTEFGWQNTVEIICQDGLHFLRQTALQFHTVFLDPPFQWKNWAQLFALLRPRLHSDAYVYIEAGRLPEIPDWLSIHREGKSGQSRFVLLRHTPPEHG